MQNSYLHSPQLLIGTLFILIFGGALYFVFVADIELEGHLKDIAFILIGVLATNTTQVINYFFGSSSGSKEKTAKLNV